MDKIRGTNLGNWLVLEKWMEPETFAGTEAEDEIWLGRLLPKESLSQRLKAHRDNYITEADFACIASQGLNLVRIPVPYFFFGDCPPYPGCVAYMDSAMDWAQKYGLKVLIDLHTVPDSQNGYDNGGITGVCKWCKNPDKVEFALSVLRRMAQRYGHHPALYGIEVLNEPISYLVYLTAPSTGKARDREEARGSGHVPMGFLKQFYTRAYKVLREEMPEEKTIVFHDGFRLSRWGRFFEKTDMKNVVLDTHIYLFAMEAFVPVRRPWVHRLYLGIQKHLIQRAQRHIPVMVGEWCICSQYGNKAVGEERTVRFRQTAQMELDAWKETAGHIYWNYKLLAQGAYAGDEAWKESWDLSKCLRNGWISYK